MISREFNQKYLGPGSLALMVAGILFLCQPWIGFLHAWSVLVMLIGIIAFNVSAHIPAPDHAEDDDTGPVSVSDAVGMETKHD